MQNIVWTALQEGADLSSLLIFPNITALLPTLLDASQLKFTSAKEEENVNTHVDFSDLVYCPKILAINCPNLLKLLQHTGELQSLQFTTDILRSSKPHLVTMEKIKFLDYLQTADPALIKDALRFLILIMHGSIGIKEEKSQAMPNKPHIPVVASSTSSAGIGVVDFPHTTTLAATPGVAIGTYELFNGSTLTLSLIGGGSASSPINVSNPPQLSITGDGSALSPISVSNTPQLSITGDPLNPGRVDSLWANNYDDCTVKYGNRKIQGKNTQLVLPFESDYKPLEVVAHAYTILFALDWDSNFLYHIADNVFFALSIKDTSSLEEMLQLFVLPSTICNADKNHRWRWSETTSRLLRAWVRAQLAFIPHHKSAKIWDALIRDASNLRKNGDLLVDYLRFNRRIHKNMSFSDVASELILRPPLQFAEHLCHYYDFCCPYVEHEDVVSGDWKNATYIDDSIWIVYIAGLNNYAFIHDWMALIKWPYLTSLLQAQMKEAQDRVIELPVDFPCQVFKTLIQVLQLRFEASVWNWKDEDWSWFIENHELYKISGLMVFEAAGYFECAPKSLKNAVWSKSGEFNI